MQRFQNKGRLQAAIDNNCLKTIEELKTKLSALYEKEPKNKFDLFTIQAIKILLKTKKC